MSDNESPIHEQVLVAIRRIIRAIDLHSRLLLEQHGLTGPQLVMLKTLVARGEMSIGELARQVHLSQATATGVLSRLEKRGLISRHRSEIDRRKILVSGTLAATELLRTAPPPLQEQFLRRFQDLRDWEQSLILSSLQRVVAMMEAEGLDATPMLVTGAIDATIPPSPDAKGRRHTNSGNEPD